MEQNTEPDLYDLLLAAECQLDHHESDLYVRQTEDAVRLVKASGYSCWSVFRNRVDGLLWIEVPFAWAPYWRAKQGKRPPCGSPEC